MTTKTSTQKHALSPARSHSEAVSRLSQGGYHVRAARTTHAQRPLSIPGLEQALREVKGPLVS